MKKYLILMLLALVTLAGCGRTKTYPQSKSRDSVEIILKSNNEVVKTLDNIVIVKTDMDNYWYRFYTLDIDAGQRIRVYQCDQDYFSWRWVRPKVKPPSRKRVR